MRRIDARSLRGLAHPLRMDILEALELDGPATSTTLSARLGENTGTISWHLRLLAEHGYIEEDVERGTKRERWWRIPGRTVLDPSEFRDDPETSGALDVYLRHLVERYFDRVRTYVDEDWSGEWQQAAALSDWRDLRLTPEQLHALNEELGDVIDRYTSTQPAGDTAERVIVQLQSFPRRSPDDEPTGSSSPTDPPAGGTS
jgi:DNA-binding transcriptional ArsR family regulator